MHQECCGAGLLSRAPVSQSLVPEARTKDGQRPGEAFCPGTHSLAFIKHLPKNQDIQFSSHLAPAAAPRNPTYRTRTIQPSSRFLGETRPTQTLVRDLSLALRGLCPQWQGTEWGPNPPSECCSPSTEVPEIQEPQVAQIPAVSPALQGGTTLSVFTSLRAPASSERLMLCWAEG